MGAGSSSFHVSKDILISEESKATVIDTASSVDEQHRRSSLDIIPKDETIHQLLMSALKGKFIFENLDQAHLNKLIDIFAPDYCVIGTEIIKQGDTEEFMYIIEEGRFEVSKIGQGKLRECARGDTIGDLSLLYNAKRSATVTCVENAKVWKLDGQTFKYYRTLHARRASGFIMNILENIPLFKELNSFELLRVFEVAKTQYYSEGEYILKKGDSGTSFYIIIEGHVISCSNPTCTKSHDHHASKNKKEVTTNLDKKENNNNNNDITDIIDKDNNNIQDKEVDNNKLRLTTGDWFGEKALLHENTKYACNIIADSPVRLLCFERDTFHLILGDLKDLIERQANNRMLLMLPLISKLPNERREKAINMFTIESYEEGETIAHCGDVNPRMIVIKTGEAYIWRQPKTMIRTLSDSRKGPRILGPDSHKQLMSIDERFSEGLDSSPFSYRSLSHSIVEPDDPPPQVMQTMTRRELLRQHDLPVTSSSSSASSDISSNHSSMVEPDGPPPLFLSPSSLALMTLSAKSSSEIEEEEACSNNDSKIDCKTDSGGSLVNITKRSEPEGLPPFVNNATSRHFLHDSTTTTDPQHNVPNRQIKVIEKEEESKDKSERGGVSSDRVRNNRQESITRTSKNHRVISGESGSSLHSSQHSANLQNQNPILKNDLSASLLAVDMRVGGTLRVKRCIEPYQEALDSFEMRSLSSTFDKSEFGRREAKWRSSVRTYLTSRHSSIEEHDEDINKLNETKQNDRAYETSLKAAEEKEDEDNDDDVEGGGGGGGGGGGENGCRQSRMDSRTDSDISIHVEYESELLEAWDCVGDDSIFHGTPMDCTIIAKENVTCFVLAQTDLIRVVYDEDAEDRIITIEGDEDVSDDQYDLAAFKSRSFDGSPTYAEHKQTRNKDIEWDRLKNLGDIGRGTFGTVYLVQDSKDKLYYALKVIDIRTGNKDKIAKHEHRLKTEVSILKQMNSPFICKLHANAIGGGKYFMVMEYVSGGDFKKLIRPSDKDKRMKREQDIIEGNLGGIPHQAAKFYIAIISLPIVYLHRRSIAYRDLKPENIIIDRFGYPKLIDFGLSKRIDETAGKTFTLCGTAEYMAPETILGDGHNQAVDWWALGVLLYEMIVGITPYIKRGVPREQQDQMDIFERIITTRLDYPEKMELSCRSLIHSLLQPKAVFRMGCGRRGNKEFEDHKWFREEMDWVAMNLRQMRAPWVPPTETN